MARKSDTKLSGALPVRDDCLPDTTLHHECVDFINLQLVQFRQSKSLRRIATKERLRHACRGRLMTGDQCRCTGTSIQRLATATAPCRLRSSPPWGNAGGRSSAPGTPWPTASTDQTVSEKKILARAHLELDAPIGQEGRADVDMERGERVLSQIRIPRAEDHLDHHS